MSRSISRRQVLLAAGAAALGLCGCRREETSAENENPELVLRYAENQPEDYPTTQAALAFAGLVNEQTGGRVRVAVYPEPAGRIRAPAQRAAAALPLPGCRPDVSGSGWGHRR